APAGAQVVDGRGKYLIPGLWDMHAHLTDSSFGRMYLAHGVTGVRHMFSTNPWYSPRGDDKARKAGKCLFPRLVAAERMLDGPVPVFPWPISNNVVCARTAEDGRAAVARVQAAGDDFVKVYTLLPRAAYRAAAAEARKRRLPLVGHVPHEVPVAEAS